MAVIDDETEVREMYKTFFNNHDEFSFVGEAANGRTGVKLYEEKHPDVLLIDLKMPIMAGEEAIRAIRMIDPTACLVALTTFATPDHVPPAPRPGASGYLLKSCGASELVRSIREARSGDMPLSAKARLALVCTATAGYSPSLPYGTEPVTSRERDLLGCLAHGLSNQEIAWRMTLSTGSVKQYLHRLGSKLGVRSRTQILAAAIHCGLIDRESLDIAQARN